MSDVVPRTPDQKKKKKKKKQVQKQKQFIRPLTFSNSVGLFKETIQRTKIWVVPNPWLASEPFGKSSKMMVNYLR